MPGKIAMGERVCHARKDRQRFLNGGEQLDITPGELIHLLFRDS